MQRRRGRKNLPISIVRPAPGELRLVQELVNTADRRKGTEELTSPQALAAWFVARGLLGVEAELSAEDLEKTIELREGLRALLAANNGAALDEQTVVGLNRSFGMARLRMLVQSTGESSFVPASPSFDDAIGRFAAVVVAAQLRGDWRRLKACAHAACQGVFYDTSRSGSAKWCSMRRCGAQLKSQTYRKRHSPPPIRLPFSE